MSKNQDILTIIFSCKDSVDEDSRSFHCYRKDQKDVMRLLLTFGSVQILDSTITCMCDTHDIMISAFEKTRQMLIAHNNYTIL